MNEYFGPKLAEDIKANKFNTQKLIVIIITLSLSLFQLIIPLVGLEAFNFEGIYEAVAYRTIGLLSQNKCEIRNAEPNQNCEMITIKI